MYRVLTLLLLASACVPAATEKAYDVYGEAFDAIGALPVDAVLAERTLYAGERVSVEGTIHAVCQMKGCWLTLRSLNGEDLRVDVARTEEGAYAFTVPKDLSGRRAVVRGVLSEEEISEAEAHHMAAEGGGPAALALSAEGVMVAPG